MKVPLTDEGLERKEKTEQATKDILYLIIFIISDLYYYFGGISCTSSIVHCLLCAQLGSQQYPRIINDLLSGLSVTPNDNQYYWCSWFNLQSLVTLLFISYQFITQSQIESFCTQKGNNKHTKHISHRTKIGRGPILYSDPSTCHYLPSHPTTSVEIMILPVHTFTTKTDTRESQLLNDVSNMQWKEFCGLVNHYDKHYVPQ